MGKSISNLYRYIEISKSITKRYIEALPEVDIEKLPLKEIKSISSNVEVKGRKYSSFNILTEETLSLFEVIARGEYLINGFNNKTIRKYIYEDYDNPKVINKMTRQLSKLRVHKIIKKANKKNKYYLTSTGRKIITSILL